jgi:hypothetical protein
MFVGRGIFQYSFGIVPHRWPALANHPLDRKPVTVVVGAPLRAKKIDNPTTEDVKRLHAKYVKELERLYLKHNPYPEIKLFID